MDSENEDYKKSEDFKEYRAKKLGFKPQSELFCNSFLPYSKDEDEKDVLDRESDECLLYIKQNLFVAVAHREISESMLFVTKLMK